MFDLLVIGGGINGAGIARDAAGRGLSVLLCEKGDLGEATSSRSGKLVHGGLRYLEYYEFRLVREALIEREVLLASAPHIIWPMRFVLPHSKEQRPAWLIRLGLLLYDYLGGRKKLPATRSLRLDSAPEGEPIRDDYIKAFEYSDCWVDDARLVVLNAIAAKDAGATILTRNGFVDARRDKDHWVATLGRSNRSMQMHRQCGGSLGQRHHRQDRDQQQQRRSPGQGQPYHHQEVLAGRTGLFAAKHRQARDFRQSL